MEISREKTNILKAIAILTVLFTHGFRELTDVGVNFFNWFAEVGVSIFLLVSGYGLAESYKRKGLGDYWKNRLTSVMLPYWCAMLLQSVCDFLILGRRMNFVEWLISFVGFNDYTRRDTIDSTMWYITFMVFCYALFWIIFIFKFNDKIKVALLLALFVVLFACQVYLSVDWIVNYLAFPIGVLISFIREKISDTARHVISAVSLLILFQAASGAYLPKVGPIITLCAFSIAGGSFFVFTDFGRSLLESRILSLIGKGSYAIYLFEGFLLFKYADILFTGVESYTNMLVFVIMSVELGILLHIIYTNISKRIFKRK